jgi:uncharacterized protein YbjQ (UPF0145 family)
VKSTTRRIADRQAREGHQLPPISRLVARGLEAAGIDPEKATAEDKLNALYSQVDKSRREALQELTRLSQDAPGGYQ